jgi:hypothetical protein
MQSSKNGIGFFIQEGPWGRKQEPMHDRQSLSDVRWECKYHVVIIPRYRGEVFYGRLRPALRNRPAGGFGGCEGAALAGVWAQTRGGLAHIGKRWCMRFSDG